MMTKLEAIEWFYNSPFYHSGHEPFNIALECIQHCIDEDNDPCYKCDDKHCSNCLYSGRIPE